MATARDVPVYIVSKGRADSRLTAKALESMDVPYHIVVEDQEYDDYAAVIEPANILVLDKQYQRDYDVGYYLDGYTGTGPGPARNFVWDHALAAGAEWHWVMDDNIKAFYRLHRNKKTIVRTDACFRAMEHFASRYRNVAMAGPQYTWFLNGKRRWPPIVLNTRIFSCNLIRSDAPFRWRLRFNEDADLSLRMLKDGWCTVQFYAFTQWKMRTQTMKGGNTDELYAKGTEAKSRQLLYYHPDVTRMVWRFGRVHHYIDWPHAFKRNRLIRDDSVPIPDEPDEFGMQLRRRAAVV